MASAVRAAALLLLFAQAGCVSATPGQRAVRADPLGRQRPR